MSANANFTLDADLFSAVKNSLGYSPGGFKDQLATLNPIFWMIMRGTSEASGGRSGGRFNKNKPTSDESGKTWWVTHGLSHDAVAGISADSIGKDPGALPTGFPNWVHLDNYTRAKFQMMYYEVPCAFSYQDMKLIGAGRMDLLNDMKKLIKRRINEALADQIYGSQNADKYHLLGLNYLMSTSNSPGGISQSDYTWWRPGYLNAGASGAITWSLVDDYQRKLGYTARSDESSATPDLILMSTGPTYDLYGGFARSIMGTQRVINAQFRDQFKLDNIQWGSAIAVPDPKITAQSIMGLNTGSFHLTGSPIPDESEMSRIPGSTSVDWVLSGMLCLSADEIKTHYKVTGHTA